MIDWSALNRIVTGNDASGRSRVLIEGGPAKMIAAGEAGLAEIWQAAFGRGLLAGEDALATSDIRLEPPPGALKVRWFTVAPEDRTVDRAAADAQAEAVFAAVGAAHARIDATRHPMMHKTDTLDVIILVRGAVDLLLDDGPPIAMKPGDVVIQRATNHAWVNHGSETALLVAVLVSRSAG